MPATTSPLVVGEEAARLGDAEVGELHVALEGDHDVLEADVAVDDAEGFAVLVSLGVRVGESTRDAAGDEDGEFAGKDAVARVELLGELFEVHASDEFHGDEIHPFDFAEVVGLDDVRVNQVGDELGLADEVLDELRLAGVVLADDLDGDALDELSRTVLLGLIHDAHAALENFADDVVAETAINGKQTHAWMVENGGVKSSLRSFRV